jgi:hypothetical protein
MYTEPHIQYEIFLAVKWPERQADLCQPPSKDKFKKVCSYSSTPPLRLYITHMDNIPTILKRYEKLGWRTDTVDTVRLISIFTNKQSVKLVQAIN